MIDFKESFMDIDEKIENYDKLINYQKTEINKTEKLIENFQTCLNQQNEALNLFITEKEVLLAERTKHAENVPVKIDYTKKELKFDHKALSVINHKDVKIVDKEQVNGISKKPDQISDLKRRIPEENREVDRKIPFLQNIPLKIQIDKLKIVEIQNATIHKILVYDNDIYVGGSNGLLLRHTPEYTHKYETNTEEDIMQVEIMQHKNMQAIHVFTKMKLIFYEDVTWYQKRQEIEIPDIGDVSVEPPFVYIPFKGGLLKKLEDNSMKQAPYVKGPVRAFLPCSEKSKLALIVLEDKLLYTTSVDEPRDFRLVRGLINIQGLRRMLKYHFVCFSRRDVWLLNSSFRIMHNITFKDIILFVEVFEGFVVVVDVAKTVHVCSLLNDRTLDVKMIYKHTFDKPITSVSFLDHVVYVSVDNEIVVLKYKF